MSAAEALLEKLPERGSNPRRARQATVRLRPAQREQPEFQVAELDSLSAPDHPAPAVWAFVDKLELICWLASRPGSASQGRPPADPKILMTLWLYHRRRGESHEDGRWRLPACLPRT